jgi:hypothetical protein
MGSGPISRRWVLAAVPVVLALGLALATWLAWPRAVAVTLDVSGTAGLPITGTAEEDGTLRELTGTVPTKIVLNGSRIVYSLSTTEKAGEFRVKTIIGEGAVGASGSGDPPNNGVRGWVKSSWGRSLPNHWIETFAKNEDATWLSPPP